MKAIFVIFLTMLMLFSAGCTREPQPLTASSSNSEQIAPTIKIITKEEVIKEYISEFLTTGYSEYYGINSIESEIIKQTIENNHVEAVICTNMNLCNPVKNPDTVPYILAAKEKAFKENNLDKKHQLQIEYMTLYSEYLKPFESNFTFKLTAELQEDEIDKASIQLFIETDANQGVKYEPAEDLLPKK
jgi:hypothetical protein